jgi:HSP20 family molecular chaperone IbpA
MSLFPRFPSTEFAPIFRLLDDYDAHRSSSSRSIPSFQPRFDVREFKEYYELHGELPGVEQKDINIEFSDAHTISISGRSVRESTTGNRSDRVSEIKDNGSRQPTVEDESDEKGQKGQEVAVSNNETKVSKKGDGPKFWVSERTVGEFHRSFNFPVRVDEDAVKATMRNGVLNIKVPKSSQTKGRRINIE